MKYSPSTRSTNITFSGFTLLELSIVLVIIAVITGMGLSASSTVIDSARIAATNNRIQAIETALIAYRQANNRLPCPADGTLATLNAGYGYEGGVAGACAGANYIITPAGVTNYDSTNHPNGAEVAEGVVPVRTLNLPDEFIYDAWGRKITYAATIVMTEVNAFVNYGNAENCGLLTVYAAGHTISRTRAADYIIFSHGPNGHGAYGPSGPSTTASVVNAGSDNLDEKVNCHCSNSAANTGYVGTYVQADVSQDPADANDNFDDIVRFKERFQMHTYADEVKTGGNLLCPTTVRGSKEAGLNGSDFSAYSVAVGDVNGDGIPDLLIGAKGVNSSTGAVYVIFGTVAGFQAPPLLTALDGTNGFVINGISTGEQVGFSVAAGDVNGDGISDIIIGAPGALSNRGSVYVVFGKTSGWLSTFNLVTLNGTNGFRINDVNTGEKAGYSVAAGDVNNDGKADIVIGAPSSGAGKVYVVYGNSNWSSYAAYSLDSTVGSGLMDTAGAKGFQALGVVSGDLAGSSVAVGDINADGVGDIIIGAPGTTSGGAVYVLYGRQGIWIPTLNLATLDGNNGFIISETHAGYAAGSSIVVGDINGDGINDIIIGAPSAAYSFATSGSVYVVYGKTAKWPVSSNFTAINIGSGTGFRLDGAAAANAFGRSVAVGDINGDGIADLIVGASGAVSGKGAAYVVFGKRSGWSSPVTISTLMTGTSTTGYELDGATAGDAAGWSVAAGDVNADGRTDVIVGADAVSGNTGKTYVYFGEQKTSGYTTPYNLGGL